MFDPSSLPASNTAASSSRMSRAASRALSLKPPPLRASIAHADGARRCWDTAFASPAESAYHDAVWGRPLPPGSSRAIFKQLTMQTFQSGLSWA